ncbi:xanthine dehydrogenase family protein molybdopterin-binding subunit [Pseudonocardia sp. H11422]|uniref:xanthine dehydrogenase family protein molybdopterin-binding subunit n=1 Tax=Pseudonocardia sp. H11422 TaxID=2835866 RepID=UPI001BDDC854|nr:xanthine dehydrogenase family protein molybdopterin-binding subunit [Pseudonocardia sp. H11422]
MIFLSSKEAALAEQRTASGPIGARIRRTEDPRLLAGQARYLDDIRLPGMLEGAVLRSPYPHARILRIDVSRARELPGVFDVITGAEVRELAAPQPVIWQQIPDQRMPESYALPTDRVRYVGEAVVAVAAVDRYVAEDALELIDIEYEPLPVAATLDEALAEDAPRLYDQWPDNKMGQHTFTRGNVDEAFTQADVVLRETLYYGRQMGLPLETRGCIASWDTYTNQLDLWLSTQGAHVNRDLMGEALRKPVHEIRVRVPDVGGGFGNKLDFYIEEVLASLMSRRTGRPVKIIEDRVESFVANAHSREQRMEVELAATSDGVITGIRGTVWAVLGGRLGGAACGPPWLSAAVMAGPYKVPNVDVSVVGVFTNRSPIGSYRGWGQPEATLVYERLVELLARKLGLDRNEVRRKNFPAPEEFPFPSTVFTYDSGRYAECLDLCLSGVEKNGWKERQAAARAEGRSVGIGYGFHVECTAFGPSRVLNAVGVQHSGFGQSVVRIDSTGRVTVYTGEVPMGQGIQTALAQVCAQSLGVPIEDVTVIAGDTDSCPYMGYGTGGSRAAALGGGAIIRAAEKLKKQIRDIGAHLLETAPEDLVIENGRVAVSGAPARSVSMAEIGNAAYRSVGKLPAGQTPTLEEREVMDPEDLAWAYGCTAVLVEVDRETGAVKVLDHLIAHDCGTVINPMIVEGQIHGGVAQSIGGALLEELVYGEDGQIQTTTFMDYLVPTATDMPPMQALHMETPAVHIPGGIKGVGEAGTIAVPAAIANAVDDALDDLDVTVTAIPITPPRLLAKIRAAQEQQS